MAKITKDEKKSIEQAQNDVVCARGEAQEELEAINQAIADLNIKIVAYNEGRLSAYNEAISAYRELLSEIAEAKRDAVSGRSESWQDGEAGQAYEQWCSEIESAGELYEADEADEAEELPDLEEIEFPDVPDAPG